MATKIKHFKKSSSQKLLGQFQNNLAQMLYQDCSNYIDPSKNVATVGVASFSYVDKGKT